MQALASNWAISGVWFQIRPASRQARVSPNDPAASRALWTPGTPFFFPPFFFSSPPPTPPIFPRRPLLYRKPAVRFSLAPIPTLNPVADMVSLGSASASAYITNYRSLREWWHLLNHDSTAFPVSQATERNLRVNLRPHVCGRADADTDKSDSKSREHAMSLRICLAITNIFWLLLLKRHMRGPTSCFYDPSFEDTMTFSIRKSFRLRP